jgi:hypothetical protein
MFEKLLKFFIVNSDLMKKLSIPKHLKSHINIKDYALHIGV